MADKILYIDDDLSSIKVFTHVFGSKYDIITQKTTRDAEIILAKNEIKVIVCDQIMPTETGLDFFNRIRSFYPEISFIIITGHANIELALEIINSGIVQRFITKPWDKNELEIAILNGLDSYHLKKQNKFLLNNLKKQNADLEIYTNQLIKTTNALTQSKEQLAASENGLQTIIENGYAKGEKYFFENMVLSLNKVLNASVTFIAKLVPHNAIETLAFCKHNQIVENATFKIENSPCELVIGNATQIFKSGVRHLFPNDALLSSIEAHAFIGTPIFSLSGIPIGILVSIFTTCLDDFSMGKSFFELFVNNIGAEMERRTIVKELKSSQLKLKNIFGSISDAIFVFPLNDFENGKFNEINQLACKRYGYSKEEFLSLTLFDITDLNSNNEQLHTLQNKSLGGKTKITYESKHRTKTGTVFPVEINANTIAIEEEWMVLAVARDISDRIKTQNELIESEAKFRQFFNKSTDAIFIADVSSGRIVDANDTACEKMGLPIESIIGLKQADIHPEHFQLQSIDLFKKHVQNIARGKNMKPLQSFLRAKNNREIPVEVNANLVTIKGKPHIMGIFRDVSLRIRVENKLIESEYKYKTAFKTSPDAVLITSPEGLILDVNEGFSNHTGYSYNDVIGESLLDLKLWKNLDDRARFFDNLNKHGKVYNFEASFIGKNGKELYALASAKPFKIKGKIHILTIARDISDRKKMEQAILESEQLLNKVFESAPYTVALLDENKEVVKINTGVTTNNSDNSIKRIGAVLNCLARCRGDKLFDPNYSYCVGCCIADSFYQTLNTGKSVFKKEVKIKVLDNSNIGERIFYISTNLIKRDNKKFVLLTIDDVTDQKLIEQELKASREKALFNEQRYTLLSDLTFEGIVLHQNLKIIDVNKSFIKLTGYTKNELIGKNLSLLLFEKEYLPLINRNIKKTYSAPYELGIITKDGKKIPVEIEAYNINLNDKSIRVTAVRNITERKEMEKKLLQAIITTEEKQNIKFAQELHDGLGPLLSNVQMYFQWLADEDENKAFVLEKGLESLQSAFISLREISNNLSPHILHDFGISRALKQFVNQIPIIENQVIAINSLLMNNRYTTNIEVAIYRIITELINNSRKHSKAKNIVVNLEHKNNKLLIDFRDDGVGFNMKYFNEIGEGHGLLNIKNRVKTLNGNMVYESEQNKGVYVLINVPTN